MTGRLRFSTLLVLAMILFLVGSSSYGQSIHIQKNNKAETLWNEGRSFSFEYSPEIKVAEKTLLMYREPSFCKSVGHSFFGNATHPGGGRGGRLNERNDGYGFTCYLNESRTRSISGQALVNSQYGLTVAWSFSQSITLIDLYGVRLDVGFSPTALSYEKRDGEVLYGILPLLFEKITFTLPRKWGHLSFVQNHLGQGIKLRNAEMIPGASAPRQAGSGSSSGFQMTFSKTANFL